MNVQKDAKLSHGVNMLHSVLMHYTKYSTCRAKATERINRKCPYPRV